MKRRGGAAAARSYARPAASFLSPRPVVVSPPKSYNLGFNGLSSSSSRKAAATGSSPLGGRAAGAASPPQRAVAAVADLRELTVSRIDAMKKFLDLRHCEILKEFETSNARLSKRFKLQTQACLQLAEEVEKDYKKMSERITEKTELMEASYGDLVAESQASASRVFKVTIPEIAQSLEKAIGGLRSRHKLPPPSV